MSFACTKRGIHQPKSTEMVMVTPLLTQASRQGATIGARRSHASSLGAP